MTSINNMRLLLYFQSIILILLFSCTENSTEIFRVKKYERPKAQFLNPQFISSNKTIIIKPKTSGLIALTKDGSSKVSLVEGKRYLVDELFLSKNKDCNDLYCPIVTRGEEKVFYIPLSLRKNVNIIANNHTSFESFKSFIDRIWNNTKQYKELDFYSFSEQIYNDYSCTENNNPSDKYNEKIFEIDFDKLVSNTMNEEVFGLYRGFPFLYKKNEKERVLNKLKGNSKGGFVWLTPIAGIHSEGARIILNAKGIHIFDVINYLKKNINESICSFKFMTFNGLWNRVDNLVIYLKDIESTLSFTNKLKNELPKEWLNTSTPPMLEKVSDGIAFASELDSKYRGRESFGSLRCKLISESFRNYYKLENKTSEGYYLCLNKLQSKFETRNINFFMPHLKIKY